jgi:hypothetical protein
LCKWADICLTTIWILAWVIVQAKKPNPCDWLSLLKSKIMFEKAVKKSAFLDY